MSTSTTDAGARAPRIHGWRRTARLGVAVLACTFAGAGQAQDECSNLNTAVNRFAPLLVLDGNLKNKEVLVHVRNFFEMGSERSLPLSKFIARRFIPALRLHGARPVGGTADENGVITLRGEWDVESEPGKLFLFLEVKQLKGGSRESLASYHCLIPVESIGKKHLEPDLESHGRFVVRKLENDLPGDGRYRLHIKPFTISGQALSEEFSGYLHDSWLPAFTESNRFTVAGSAGQSDGELHGTVRVLGRDVKVVKVSLRILGKQEQAVAATNVELASGLVEEFFVLVDPCARHVEAKRSADAAKCYGDVLKETPGDTQALAGLEGLAGTKFRDCPECPELVVVPSGSYEMGSPSSEAGRDGDEGPVHRVTIGRPFAVGVKEVTVGEYGRFVSETGRSMGDSCRTYEGGGWESRSGRGWRNPGFSQTDGHPVVCVSWHDAKAYVGWLSGETGEEYRLLSESEWEYVARGGTGTSRYWGESESGQCRYANGGDKATKRRDSDWKWAIASCDDGHARTAPVGRYEENGYGLHDVLGNVWEWVEDCWNGSYAGAPSDGSAWGSGDCDQRVLRGGSWLNGPRILRSANRFRNTTGLRDINLGFRVARTLTP